MICRDDIYVSRVSNYKDGVLTPKGYQIEIHVGKKRKRTYAVKLTDVADFGTASDILIEKLMKMELGITKHDFIMKISKFLEWEEGRAEEGSDGSKGQADRSSEGST